MLPSKMKWNFTYNETDKIDLHDGLTPLTQQLLHKRQIHTEGAIQRFLHPSIDDLHDPFLMEGMELAVTRVKQAIDQEESILVFGDYDADGVSSTTLMVEALRKAGADCDFYIPNRFTEGYGPNKDAFQFASDSGFSVIITVDTGIAAVEEAAFAKELGIDLIITDHHEVQEKLPEAFAIIHPKTSTEYPFQELAGVGVAFKFAHALLGYFPNEFLDLVVIGTIADLVPLHDENRILAKEGLKAISRSSRPGIQALKKVCGIESEFDEETIGFTIGPRINAVGRLQDATPAVDLLLSDNMEEALEIASFIDKLNQERQKIVADIAKEAEAMIEAETVQPHVIIVAKAGWNPGVLGIVASKLVRKFDRPAIVLGIDEEKGEAKGSARSINAFDLFSNCMEIRDRFIHFGGHAQAAGMTVSLTQLDSLRQELNQLAEEKLNEDDFKQTLEIEATINVEDVSLKQIEEVDQLRPFGMGNPKPLFHFQHQPKEIRLIGSRKNHLKLSFQQGDKKIDGVGFGLGELYPFLAPADELQLVGELGVNVWNGKKNLQIMVKDMCVSDWQLFDFRGSKHIEKSLTVPPDQHIAAATFHESTHGPHQIPVYDGHTVESLEVDGLVLLDLPDCLESMENLLKRVKTSKIYACYYLEDSTFLKTWPSRDHFKWFYGMLLKRKSFDLSKEGPLLAKKKGWDQSMINFISEVFFELEFVKIIDGLVTPHPSPSKKDLKESKLYKKREEKLKIEQTLYYSSYRELKNWFHPFMEQESRLVKEEVVNGL